MDNNWRPLEGVKVVELARILAGPWLCQTLADLGADVIKIESPAGDDTRQWGPPFVDHGGDRSSTYYYSANRGKRAITADLSDPEDLAMVKTLTAEADIFVENFKVGGLRKFGLDPATLRAERPDLIVCSITGFGQDGPYAARPGYDFIIQGMGGIMDITGEPDAEPQKPGVAYADLFTGLYGVIAVQAALLKRRMTGEGAHIDMALLDSQVAVLANQAQLALASDRTPTRMGNAHPALTPYQVFQAADGPFIIAVGNDAQFTRLCDELGLGWVARDPKFSTNPARNSRRDEMLAHLIPAIAARTQADLAEALTRIGVPNGAINRVDQALEHPQIRHRGLRIDAGPVEALRAPIIADGKPAAAPTGAPVLNEHGDAIRARLARGESPWSRG